MIVLNAILRAKAGRETEMGKALAEMTDHVTAAEPGTIGFHVGQDRDDPRTFVTYERFADAAAMEAHNGSAYRDAWIARHGDLFDGDIVRYICDEVATKGS